MSNNEESRVIPHTLWTKESISSDSTSTAKKEISITPQSLQTTYDEIVNTDNSMNSNLVPRHSFSAINFIWHMTDGLLGIILWPLTLPLKILDTVDYLILGIGAVTRHITGTQLLFLNSMEGERERNYQSRPTVTLDCQNDSLCKYMEESLRMIGYDVISVTDSTSTLQNQNKVTPTTDNAYSHRKDTVPVIVRRRRDMESLCITNKYIKDGIPACALINSNYYANKNNNVNNNNMKMEWFSINEVIICKNISIHNHHNMLFLL